MVLIAIDPPPPSSPWCFDLFVLRAPADVRTGRRDECPGCLLVAMSETTLQKVEAEVQKLTAELQSVEQAQASLAVFLCCAFAVHRPCHDYVLLVCTRAE